MIFTNGKTPDSAGVCQCVEPCLICCGNSTTATPKIQLPRMGSCLRAFLKRYRDDLQPLADRGDRVAAGMVDCCTALLNEADRIEGGRP